MMGKILHSFSGPTGSQQKRSRDIRILHPPSLKKAIDGPESPIVVRRQHCEKLLFRVIRPTHHREMRDVVLGMVADLVQTEVKGCTNLRTI